ncbi:MAG: peptidylprolyl isomerase [Burkholderiales bacterium]|nr:peptidylprolyl isomerase [Burkholderiales bacterium]
MPAEAMQAQESTPASVNGVNLHAAREQPGVEELRQRACTELLRQAAMAEGLLDPADTATDGVISEVASAAIESLLSRALTLPEPAEDACRRYYAAHAARYSTGERVRVRHILFAVTPGVDVTALRGRAEACLIDVRSCDRNDRDAFAASAAKLSNCPSGQQGGDLGWLAAGDCAPEFARELFGRAEVGVLPRLVHSRFGLHVVEVLQREPGASRPFDDVRDAVATALRQQAYVTALRQYLRVLAGGARLTGVELDPAVTPLVQ